nr:T9SS type A sorting domain-containing protein [Candidatus Delongbacteria bacterium]
VSDIWVRSYDYGYAAGEYSTPHSYFTYGQDWSGPIVGPYLISWGSGSYYGDALMKIVFEYPNGTPPQVLGMTRPNNTYDLAGNKSVTATIADADGTIASANLMYAVSAGAATYQSVAMTYNDTKGTWTGTISGSFAAGDTVYYYVEATDNDGKARNNQSGKQYFRIMAPENAQAQILVVLESEDDQAVYETILAKLGKQYELWVVPDNNGIDATIIAHPQWKTILWNAHGSAYMFYPQYTKDVLANYKPIWKQIFTFLDNGGSLFYSDYDYFYTCASGTDSTMDLAGTSVGVSIGKVGETHAGYSYFGVQTFWSDPCLVTDAYYPKGEKDFAGVASDPITNDWASTDLTAVDRTDHWGDYVEVAPNSKKILTGKAYGYDVGTRTSNGTWATVFLPWNFSILADTTGGANTSPDAEKLMKNILDYLDAKTSGIDDDPFYTNPMRTELFSNYPNPFNPTTELSFSLAQAGTVQLEIYDIVGQKVKTLVNDYKSVGTYRLSWNGLDDSGNKVSSGVYFYRLKTADYTKTQKMMFLK